MRLVEPMDNDKKAPETATSQAEAGTGATSATNPSAAPVETGGPDPVEAADERDLSGPQETDKAGVGARDTGKTGESVDAANGDAPDEITELRRQNDDLMDRLLRTAAEMDNLRKRTAREKVDTAKYAIADFAKSILTVGDSMHRARLAVSEQAMAEDPTLKSFVEGIEMTEKEFQRALERHGVTRFDPKGEPFDPNLHHAMLEVDAPGVAAKTIVDVFEVGYKIADRVLRSASVSIAKGGAKPIEPAGVTAANDDGPEGGPGRAGVSADHREPEPSPGAAPEADRADG